MRNSVFITFCLLLFASFLQFCSFVHYKFSGIDRLRAEIVSLKKTTGEEKLKARLAQYQLADYQQYVATLLPAQFRAQPAGANAYPLRSLASIAGGSVSNDLQIERASSFFERGRTAFTAKDFEKSNAIFSNLLSMYPNSVHAPDAYFLLAEGQYQSNEFDDCIKTVDTMISLYPDHDLTGFALIRLGKIYENQERVEDAIDVYHAILKSYDEPALKQQAQASLKAVQL